ncbi:MAG: class I lanthipeptide [bacterium]
MKKITKKLTLHKEVVRSLADGELGMAQGGRINQTVSACEGECIPQESLHCTQGIVCATGPH